MGTLGLLSTAVSIVLTMGSPLHSTPLALPNEPNAYDPSALDNPVTAHRIQALKSYAAKNRYSTRYGLFANLQVHSGLKRLYVVNLETHRIQETALVTHGHCKEYESSVRFSNVPESNCSSEGKYSIGKAYSGIFGLAYKLHGLEPTNSNAYARHIVLHAHPCVDEPTWPEEICESEGCPTVSPAVLQKLKNLIDSEDQSILLWIYKS